MIITGPAPVVTGWIVDWMRGFRGSSPRHCLAVQLRVIRGAFGVAEAIRFRRVAFCYAGDVLGKKARRIL
jgi:hypothetical protein